ncbi:gamma-glutamyl-gamma-aminobutyrate hydrolase family protein [Sedimentibacter sp. B4]|uniref:gamma-glutamyl-gamma-aminobutyrate hydrolase family protein n=1 Tax=Sedimentibacter sp. B4 TaxID=304766 RepID=UPI0002F4AD1C|nr:gamma-glutamyl-gamma-aminobutyrate hydrolase family protein [Sedimentibacter sp. B4]
MKKPMIGIVPLYDEKKESYWILPGYMKGIERAGGIPVMLPLTSDEDMIASIAEIFDGFLFTGGHDVDPVLYGEVVEEYCGKPCRERDVMEEVLFKHVLELDKPALGICRGLQLFNVLLGGNLYQDIIIQREPKSNIEHQQKPPYDKLVHSVKIEKDTILYGIIGKETIDVNSYHHQGIKQLSKQLKCAAKAEDGMIESVFMPDKRFVLAVQWHPEFIFNSDDDNLKLFVEFVKAVFK